jgi:hypothetical protein
MRNRGGRAGRGRVPLTVCKCRGSTRWNRRRPRGIRRPGERAREVTEDTRHDIGPGNTFSARPFPEPDLISMQIVGDSMIGDGIHDGDFVIDRGRQPVDGVAVVLFTTPRGQGASCQSCTGWRVTISLDSRCGNPVEAEALGERAYDRGLGRCRQFFGGPQADFNHASVRTPAGPIRNSQVTTTAPPPLSSFVRGDRWHRFRRLVEVRRLP